MVIGKTKYEVRGNIIDELVGLKSKMYSLVMVYDKEIKKAKGINKDVVDNIRQMKYVVLFGQKIMRHNVKRIQNELHKI